LNPAAAVVRPRIRRLLYEVEHRVYQRITAESLGPIGLEASLANESQAREKRPRARRGGPKDSGLRRLAPATLAVEIRPGWGFRASGFLLACTRKAFEIWPT
jgi:hypothetical protein